MATLEDKIFDALAIRDTANYFSTITDNIQYNIKTILIQNGLNQILTCQLQGAREDTFTDVYNVGNSFTVNANTNDYQPMTNYFPYLRLKVSSTTPTTGTLTAYLERAR